MLVQHRQLDAAEDIEGAWWRGGQCSGGGVPNRAVALNQQVYEPFCVDGQMQLRPRDQVAYTLDKLLWVVILRFALAPPEQRT